MSITKKYIVEVRWQQGNGWSKWHRSRNFKTAKEFDSYKTASDAACTEERYMGTSHQYRVVEVCDHSWTLEEPCGGFSFPNKPSNTPSGWELPKSLAFDVREEGCQAQEDLGHLGLGKAKDTTSPAMFGGDAADKPVAADNPVTAAYAEGHHDGFCAGYNKGFAGYNKGFHEGFKYGRSSMKHFYDAIAAAETESRLAGLPKPDMASVIRDLEGLPVDFRLAHEKSRALKDLAVLERSNRVCKAANDSFYTGQW